MANAFDEAAKNKFKSYLLMFLFALILIGLAYVMGLWYGKGNQIIVISFIFIAFFISIILSLISYFWGDKAALQISNARPANKREHAHYINSVEGLAIAAQIPTPNIYVLPDQSINAFATGRDPNHASIAVTEGALKKLNRTELEGVIAHEIAHIKNYDMRLMTITVILVGLIALLSDLFIRSMWFGNDRDSGRSNVVIFIIGIFLAILAPIISELIKLAISRKREYAADATGAILSRHPKGLADALRKIQKDSVQGTKIATKATAHLFFSNPFKKNSFSNLFSTHPPIEERIRRLESM